MIDWQLNGLETVNPRRQNRRKIKAEKKEKKKERRKRENTHSNKQCTSVKSSNKC